MVLEAQLSCSGTTHTLVVDGDLVLVDHQTEQEQVFDALRGGADEGCLLIRKAWDGVTRSDAEREFLHALLVEDEDIRGWMHTQLAARVAYGPQIQAAMGVENAARCRRTVVELALWKRALLDLPWAFRVAFCRSLHQEHAALDDDELRLELVGEERFAEVLRFRHRGPS